jgi:glycosyltransferase involved in cell wall biosynthesis/spore maturation protein CgeB
VKPPTLLQESVPVTREELVSAFVAQPSKGAVVKLISHDYFVRGAILEPAEFILQHHDLLREAEPKELALIQNILGQRELLTNKPLLSPRQPNPGYLVERNRVMYCAHSTGYFNSNGYSTRTAGVVEGLTANGVDVLVVARPGYPWDSKVDVDMPEQARFELEISGVSHVFNPGPTWTADRLDFYLAEAVDVYVREAQRNRVSLIHSASNYVTALPALMAARRLGIPFVYEVRGLWEITELSSKENWQGSDRYQLAVVRDELVQRGVKPFAIDLMENSVDTETFTPMPPHDLLRQTLGLSVDATVIGYAGSLVPYEGVEDLLLATKIVLDAGLDVQLVVVGDGAQLSELKLRASAIGIQERVTFTGRVPAADVPDYMSLFDIMPCPRRRLPVTEMVSPLKPLEAMASSKALILSDLAPLRDFAGATQERALLCESGNPASLASAITVLATDPELRMAMGRRARLWTIRERTWRTAGSKALEAHRRATLVAASPSSRPLSELTVGIISDEFTLEGLRGETNLVELLPDSWREQFASRPIDALFVESAWEGSDGLWNRKVGFYDEERFSTLKSILEHCNVLGIPTIFWNKEDPVHFNRFSKTSSYFDHVFSTDSDCIRRYKEIAGPRQRTVASLPFYAQPRMHNLVPPNRPYDHSVAYAGSFYGDRYKSRSDELTTILDVAKKCGLAIYDRQHLAPDSPYRFPDDLGRFVRGGLSYAEMVDAYKCHPVHINVNSVESSPTMFSRRVMEVAASGSVVISGRGVGVEQVMNGLVPVVSGSAEAELLIQEWMGDEPARLRDAWLAYRHVHRGHTAGHRLAYILRTAGLVVAAPTLPSYAVFVRNLTAEVALMLESQTVQPARIYCANIDATFIPDPLSLPVELVAGPEDASERAGAIRVSFMGFVGREQWDRTMFEDMLTTASFGTWGSISISGHNVETPGLGLAQFGPANEDSPQLRALSPINTDRGLRLRRQIKPAVPGRIAKPSMEPRNVLVAGHDLKFASGIISQLTALGHHVTVDKWHDHNKHDEAESNRLLKEADVIFCEWTLGNAVWYSRNKASHQRMVTRLHLQEIFRPFVKQVSFHEVDEVIFVGKHILDVAVRDHGVPAAKSKVIPNAVDIVNLRQDKKPETRFNLGFVGMVPARKRLDKALDILRLLRLQDTRYRLFVKGKRPEEFAWMANRPEEMFFYEEQYLRIASDPVLAGAVVFDQQGDDMAQWYNKIGVVLSVSDFESFHMTLPDGAASGALPVSLAWPGADQIYPTNWLHSDVSEIAERIVKTCTEPGTWEAEVKVAQQFVTANMASAGVLTQLCAAIVGCEEAELYARDTVASDGPKGS